MRMPRHDWLIWLYRVYARIHGEPDIYERAERLGEKLRAEMRRREWEIHQARLAQMQPAANSLQSLGSYQLAMLQNAPTNGAFLHGNAWAYQQQQLTENPFAGLYQHPPGLSLYDHSLRRLMGLGL